MTPAKRRELVDRQNRSLSIVRQCALLGVSRSSLYYCAKGTPPEDLSLMRELDRQYLETPFVNGGGMLGHWGGVKLYHLVRSCPAKASSLTGQ